MYTINDVDAATSASGISYRRAQIQYSSSSNVAFFKPPQDISGTLSLYEQTKYCWNSDIHLISTYMDQMKDVFLHSCTDYLLNKLQEYEQLSVANDTQITNLIVKIC